MRNALLATTCSGRGLIWLALAVVMALVADLPGVLRTEAVPVTNVTARYVHLEPGGLRPLVVREFSIARGPVEQREGRDLQWLRLSATKANGQEYRVWLLTDAEPAEILDQARRRTTRYLLQPAGLEPREFRGRSSGKAVLPSMGGWTYLWPRAMTKGEPDAEPTVFPRQTQYLGHTYRRVAIEESGEFVAPTTAKVYRLLPDVLVGVPSNTRQKESGRRYDGSEYTYTRLTELDYREMAAAGINCFRVDRDQLPCLDDLDVFYWGLSPGDLAYPECLYDSRYLGPSLFLDEPAVCTRDYVLRPRLAKDEAFRKTLTPALAFGAFQEFFQKAVQEGAATTLLRGLAAKAEIDTGEMHFPQENLFSWETMVSTAACQLSLNPLVPAALVFEPPGRLGTLRTLPELDMTYGCQIPVDNPNNFIDVIYGFLRGAARLTGKGWGTSIYGAVDRADAPWFLAHAYELGATRFFFWDNAQLACVPYDECLRLARTLKMLAENQPQRDLDGLKHAAEVAIVLPVGYNLGHVFLGKGNLWGLSELNLERVNAHGVTYRRVMANFFTEIERCLRLGVGFDLFGDFPGLTVEGYREVVHIREDGTVEVSASGQHSVLAGARTPMRPGGTPPELAVDLSTEEGHAPLAVTARARVTVTSAPVYYTYGADPAGVYHNAVVAWELYGPTELDHRFLTPPALRPRVVQTGKTYEVVTELRIDKPGSYRLRAATVDRAGRSTVVWKSIGVRN